MLLGGSASAVPVGPVARAEGPLGRTVAEIGAQRPKLAGKPVRVRGVVVKVNAGILGHTFLHLQDGSAGDAGPADLAVTTDAEPPLGSTVLVEGTLAVDKDFGSGYRYPVLLENARLIDAK